MKNRILLSFLAAGVLLSGCSKNESGDPSDGGRVPIRLGSGVATVSKAPVTGPVISGTQFEAGIAGWENTATETYAAAPLWNTTIQTTANAEEGQAVTWTAQQYYNADEGTATYMKAWYPAGTLSGTTVTFSNTDGDVDALLAPVVSGTKLTKDDPDKVLAFAHRTAQINFKVQAGAGLAANTTLRSIKIKDAQLPTGFDLTKEITADDVVTYSTAADLTVPGITADAVTIAETAAPAGNPVMIKPISGNTFSIDVETNNATYTGQTVTVTGTNVEAGTAYDVTLTVGQSGISLKATVTAWKTETGSADIK